MVYGTSEPIKGNEQLVRNEIFAATATSQTLSYSIKRTAFMIRNSGILGELVTIAFGKNPAVASAGIVLTNGQAYTESDSEGFETYSGDIQIIASANCNVSYFER